ncbi:MAG: ISAs1 family transposase [Silvanigrellales bacterium]|jgi:predicted transposase YbfD/YdcC|nr:ISAs1 family transposase [Silvanigrellales bacterium]
MAAFAHLNGADSQRRKEAFLKALWPQFLFVCKALGVECSDDAPSDSTIRRVCIGVDFQKAVAVTRGLSAKSHAETAIDRSFRQYAIDGKNRASSDTGTGKSEIDVTLFDVDTATIIDKRIVGANEGEQPISCELVAEASSRLPSGVITGDAGIVSPEITRTITDSFHDYLFTLKGNAGEAYHLIRNLPWREFDYDTAEVNYGHGRTESRGIRIARISGSGIEDLEKYAHISYIGEIIRYRSIDSTPEESTTAHYFIGSERHVEMTPEGIAAALRKHWSIENHLHRVRDVELGEDALPSMGNEMSRMCGLFIDLATWLGNGLTRGFRYFMQSMKANPISLLEAWLNV